MNEDEGARPLAARGVRGTIAFAAALCASGMAHAGPPALCASPAQAPQILQQLDEPRANYWGVAGQLGTTEAAVLSAVAAARGGAASGGESFAAVWESLRAWPDAVAIVMKAGHVFEVHGRINAGEPSKQSRYFNLQGHEGLSGHLRPDLVAAIYAIELPGRNGPEHGIAFADAAGGVAFAVYAPAGDEATAEGLKAWQATRALIAGAAPLCDGRAPDAARP